MDESVSQQSLLLQGKFIDILDGTLPVIEEKVIPFGSHALLYDLEKIKSERAQILLSASRTRIVEQSQSALVFTSTAPLGTNCVTVLRLPQKPRSVELKCEDGSAVSFDQQWDQHHNILRLFHKNLAEIIQVRLGF
jgi:hypothetical protein